MASLITRKDRAVGTIVLSNPEKFNAMTFDMWCALPAALQLFDQDATVRVIVLEGDGERAFMSGSDISQFQTQRSEAEARERYNSAVEDAHRAAERCGKPVVAKIKGLCIGGGVGLAASCDVRLCGDNARFRIPAARIGLGYPTAGLARLVPLLGPQTTMDILFSARTFGAEEALRMGLVAQIYPTAELDAKVGEWLDVVSQNAPLTLRALKLAMAETLGHQRPTFSGEVKAAIAACFESNDYKEGTRAFAEKRVPMFGGS